ncbi:Ig-like domain-containing protein, partial [Patescibacteria group bacterium]|nr:Ig-like domain-containing protein [Patescibacteria group bacterium]
MRSKSNNKLVLSAFIGFGVTVLAIAGAVFFWAPGVVAQVNIDPNIGTTFGLGTADLLSTVINVVQWALGFLGLVAVIFIMYGGFIWMTAAGNQEKVAKAKQIIQRAVIGLVIVLLAWAIVLFVIDRTSTLSGGGGGSSCNFGDVNGCYDCDISNNWVYNPDYCGLPGNAFYVRWVDPAEDETNVLLCTIIQVQFNEEILPASVPGNAHFIVEGGDLGGIACTNDNDCASALCTGTCQGDEVAGAWNVAAKGLEFLPDSNYLDSTTYRVDLVGGASGIDDTGSLDSFAGKTWWFTTGSTTLPNPPTVTAIYPSDRDIDLCLNTAIQGIFSQKMRVSSINTSTVKYTNLDGSEEDLASPFGYPNPKSFSTRPATPMTAGDEYSVKLIAGDPASTDPLDGIMDVCRNHLDGNYDTADDGSSAVPISDDFMTINDNPTAGDAPPWNFFADTDTTNVQCVPEISGITPASSMYHESAVQISGSNFGIIGNVVFNNQVNDNNTCFDSGGFPRLNCVSSWAGGVIDTRVPGGPLAFQGATPSAGAMDGGVTISVTPGICVGGINNGIACNVATDCPDGICATDSNSYNFGVASPQIHRVSGLNDQPHGGTGQFVTLTKRSGSNAVFGQNTGFVFIWDLAGNPIIADYPTCATTWTDNQVLIKIPDIEAGLGITPCDVAAVGGWQNCPASTHVGIQILRSGFTETGNIIKFIYTNEPPGPGLCEAIPSCGIVNDSVTLNGDAFGSAPGVVYFNSPLPVFAPISSWNQATIVAQVPILDNGNYSVNVQDASGIASNAVLFDVPCGDIPRVLEQSTCAEACVGGTNAGAACSLPADCPSGVCSPSMASPNPYRDKVDVCTNVIMAARFVDADGLPIAMNSSTLTDPNNIKLYRCDDPDNSPSCSLPIEVAGVTLKTFPFPEDERVILTPPVNLDLDRYYRMFISKEVKSSPPDPAKMNADYNWVFKTKSDPALCPVENVLVAPADAVLYNLGDTKDYEATPVGPECTLVNPGDYTWAWSSDDPGIASVTGSVIIYKETATANDLGTTYINAETEGKIGKGRLKVEPDSCVFDPARCSDPLAGGCGSSVCDITLDKCTPWIESLSPASGPPGSFDSVNGCWFGDTAGNLIYGSQFATFECSNGWSKSLIVGTVPSSLADGTYLVEVETIDVLSNVSDSGQDGSTYDGVDFNVTSLCASLCAGGANANAYCTVNADCDSGSCNTPGVPPPPDGVPGICPPLNPASGKEGTNVTIEGLNLINTLDTSNTRVYYHEGLADYWNDVVNVRGQTWVADNITTTQIPVGTQTGDVMVQVNNCPSNALTFGISCNSNGDCLSSGCCVANICQDASLCSTGGVGELCQIEENLATTESPENPNCVEGPITPPSTDYSCISNTGDTSAIFPPPPESSTTIAFGDDCRFCCTPGDVNIDDLICAENVGVCDGAGRGLYCGCSYDASVPGPGDAQCGALSCGNDTCCYPKPISSLVAPSNKLCRNAVLSIEFNQQMDQSTFVLGADFNSQQVGESIFVYDNTNAVNIPGYIVTNLTRVDFYADDPMPVNIQVSVYTSLQYLRNSYGIVAGIAGNFRNHAYTIDAAAQICKIDHIEITYWDPLRGFIFFPPPSLFTCDYDGCPGDFLFTPPFGPEVDGMQHFWIAYPKDVNDNQLSGQIKMSWSENDPQDIFSVSVDKDVPYNIPCPPESDDSFGCFVDSNNKSGRGDLVITADGTNSPLGDLGKVTQSARINAIMCSSPWPSPFSPDFDELPYQDSATSALPKADSITGSNNFITNFSTWYCRDDGVPALNPASNVVIREGFPLPFDGKNELIKEYFFLRAGSDDAIGIRVMENETQLSPTDWYFDQFGRAAPTPQKLIIDGYQAVRAGRTVYVGATNLVAGALFSNVYLISYNEGASGETLAIYNRLLSNWEFNFNMDIGDKEKLQRDMRRINDLNDVYSKLLDYKGANGFFPLLEGGTYVRNMSTSKWPSWQDTLGAAAGSNLPVDPINTLAVPHTTQCLETSYNQSTCWDDTNKRYECPGPLAVGD